MSPKLARADASGSNEPISSSTNASCTSLTSFGKTSIRSKVTRTEMVSMATTNGSVMDTKIHQNSGDDRTRLAPRGRA